MPSIRCLSSKVLKKQRGRIRVGKKSLSGPVGSSHCRQPGVLEEKRRVCVGVAAAEDQGTDVWSQNMWGVIGAARTLDGS